jgi:hypothetical protein
MSELVTVRLARADARLPMPDRDLRLFGESEVVDLASPFWRGLYLDGDIVVASDASTTAEPVKAAAGKTASKED